jgi:hypothetical protein
MNGRVASASSVEDDPPATSGRTAASDASEMRCISSHLSVPAPSECLHGGVTCCLTLTDSGRATLTAILEDAEIGIKA